MSGSEKLQALERFHAELRYYGQAPFSLGAAAAVPPAPHPFIAHFYPLAARSERSNLGYSRSSNPIPQPSSAAALVALAASGCVGKNISSQLLQNLQNQPSKKNLERKGDNYSDLVPSSDGPPKKKLRHQFSVDSLSGTSPQPQHNFSQPSQQNALIQYPGISGLAASTSFSAWQQLFNRFRNFDNFSNTLSDRSADFGKTSPLFGNTREKSSFQLTNHSARIGSESGNQRNHNLQADHSFSSHCLSRPKESGSNQFLRRQRDNQATTPNKVPTESPLCNSPVDEVYDAEMFEKSAEENSFLMEQQKHNCRESMSSTPPNSGVILRKDGAEDDSLKSTNCRCSSASSDQSRDDLSERKRKKRLGSARDTCPVCGITVRSSELEAHIQQEIEKLAKIPSEVKRKHMNSRRSFTDKRSFRNPIATSSMSSTGKKYSELSAKSTQNNRFKTFQKVRSNRHERLNMKVGQGLKAHGSMANSYNFNMAPFAGNPIWSASSPWSPHLNNLPSSCPVCCTKLQGSLSDMHEHIGRCLRQRNVNHQMLDEDVDVDVVDTPPYVNGSTHEGSPDEGRSDKSFGSEYEWCGQTRIRATSLVDKATLASTSGFYLVKPPSSEEESDRYLNVEADDTQAYGPTQYMEKNLIHSECASDTEKTSCDRPGLQQSDGSAPPSPGLKSNMADMVASLRGKIESLESETRSTRCMICMDVYKDPVASVQCWHVHCENCWMRALAVKKLCPQCNAITPPDKLRRIYL